MNVIKTPLAGCVVIEPQVYGDQRGFFLETFQAARYAEEAGIQLPFVQDLPLIHLSEPRRRRATSYAAFCLTRRS